ncbi:MAG: oligosaccharide flippase family protein [Anaerohalosphaera sp.]|nr:oligosaccharide flippase family protein [Anaerohalosphaera sp.]
MQVLAFAQYIVLARVLQISDIGLLGLSMLLIQTLGAFTQTGFQTVLIQKKGAINDYLNTAWTFGLARAALLYLLLFLLAPYVAMVKVPIEALAKSNLEMAPQIIRVMGLSIFLGAFTNIGILYFQKDLEFHKQFAYQIITSLIKTIITITLALIWKSIWALVIGKLIGETFGCIASYRLSSYRPRFSFDKVKLIEMWRFGKWIFVTTALDFLVIQGDDYFVWAYLGWVPLAFYQMAYKLASIPALEIGGVLAQVTFPAYSKIQDQPLRIKEAYLKVLNFAGFLSFLIGGLVLILSLDFVLLFLKAKWIPIVAPMQILAALTILKILKCGLRPISLASGNPHWTTYMQIIRLIIIGVLIWPLTAKWQISGTALTIVITSIVTIPTDLYVLRKNIDCKVSEILQVLFSYLISFLAMLVVTIYARLYYFDQISFVNLFVLAALATAVYITVSVICDKFFDTGLVEMIKQKIDIATGN